MRLAMITVGSRGDILPYVALGAGLKAAGHEVRLATHAMFENAAREKGVDFRSVRGNPREVMESDMGRAWGDAGRNVLASTRRLREVFRPLMSGILSDCWAACQGAEALVFSPLAWYFAGPVMEKLNVPGLPASLQPIHPTAAFPNPYFPQVRWGPLYNRLTYTLADGLVWRLFRGLLNAARAEVLDLPPLPRHSPLSMLRRTRIPVLYGYSSALLPRPADWGDGQHVSGYWFDDAPPDWTVPPRLRDFLTAGPPPVYVGFGSQSTRDPEGMTRLAVRALQFAGQRGILCMGWKGMTDSDLPDDILPVDDVPHDWLMPRVRVTVHHGGAGTTAVGLRAGVPTVTVPFFADQPFWSRCVYEAGAGPAPLNPRTLTAEKLAAAIRCALTDPGMTRCAADLGVRLRKEDGVGRAVDIVERLLGQSEGGFASRR